MIPDMSKVEEEKTPEPETIMINTTDSKKNSSKGGNIDPSAKKTKQKIMIPAMFW